LCVRSRKKRRRKYINKEREKRTEMWNKLITNLSTSAQANTWLALRDADATVGRGYKVRRKGNRKRNKGKRGIGEKKPHEIGNRIVSEKLEERKVEGKERQKKTHLSLVPLHHPYKSPYRC
jgi:hypothetical protein